jgi:predicted nucleic acid-binding protein
VFLVSAREFMLVLAVALLLFGGVIWALWRKQTAAGKEDSAKHSRRKLDLLYKKGVLSKEEYNAALKRLTEPKS